MTHLRRYLLSTTAVGMLAAPLFMGGSDSADQLPRTCVNATQMSDCSKVNGEIRFSEDLSEVRIRESDAGRLLVVDPNEHLPANLRLYLNNYVVAEFLVCPVVRRNDGGRPVVCVKSATGVRAELINGGGGHVTTAGITNAETRLFLTGLQEAVHAGDVVAVSQMIHYPIYVELNGQPTQLASPEQLQQEYSRVFTPGVQIAIAEQKFAELFVNWKGVMLGNGEVWFSGVCLDEDCNEYDIGIMAVNNWLPERS